MQMLTDLFSTDYGLMSLAVIVFVIVMWIWFTILFLGKIRLGEDPEKHKQICQSLKFSLACAGKQSFKKELLPLIKNGIHGVFTLNSTYLKR